MKRTEMVMEGTVTIIITDITGDMVGVDIGATMGDIIKEVIKDIIKEVETGASMVIDTRRKIITGVGMKPIIETVEWRQAKVNRSKTTAADTRVPSVRKLFNLHIDKPEVEATTINNNSITNNITVNSKQAELSYGSAAHVHS